VTGKDFKNNERTRINKPTNEGKQEEKGDMNALLKTSKHFHNKKYSQNPGVTNKGVTVSQLRCAVKAEY
jgi:hypothetical protein